MAIKEGDEIWRPSAEQIRETRLAAFMDWLQSERGQKFDDYEALWRWSSSDLDGFWSAIWQFFDIQADGQAQPVLAERIMPGATWFPNVRLNYAEHIFRNASDRPAILARAENRDLRSVTWQELERATGALAASLRAMGVEPGDRVVSYMTNVPETVIAFLACASIGAIWSSCSPEMGVSVVLDRYSQIQPKVLFAVDSYTYNGKLFDRADIVAELLEKLPSVENVIHVRGPAAKAEAPAWPGYHTWDDMVAKDAPLAFERLPF